MTKPDEPPFQLPAASGSAILTLDLEALAANYRLLMEAAGKAQIAGVVKADGYGCGANEVATRLSQEGCRLFFVTSLEEALSLRACLSDETIQIAAFNGTQFQDPKAFANNGIIPVLNSLEEYRHWQSFCQSLGKAAPYALHIDTGMNRQGMSFADAETISADKNLLGNNPPEFIMSHLASADRPQAAQNAEQKEVMARVAALFPGIPTSLANSAGIFLGADYVCDIVRPGIALYGGQPIEGRDLDLKPVVYLHAPIIQIRKVDAGETIGYGGTYKAERTRRIATVPLGYADGILRTASNKAHAYLAGHKLPLVGKISMDLITFDISEVPDQEAQLGTYIEILGQHVSVDDLGRAAGSFGYEILTSLGARYDRHYIGKNQ